MSEVLDAQATVSVCPQRSIAEIFSLPKQASESIQQTVNSPQSVRDAERDRLTASAWNVLACWCGQDCVVGVRSALRRPFLCSQHRAEVVRTGRRQAPVPAPATQAG